MTQHYLLRHFTEYRYEGDVELAHNQMRMHLRNTDTQVCLQRSMSVLPRPSWTRLQGDYFDNKVLWMEVDKPHKVSKIFIKHLMAVDEPVHADAAASLSVAQMQALLQEDRWAQEPHLVLLRLPSRFAPPSAAIKAFAEPFFPPERPVLECAIELMQHIHAQFSFSPDATTVATPVDEVLAKQAGVCQDFAHLMVTALRSVGLAVRYVSGYIETLPPPGQPRLVGADASHAWVSLWCGPEQGWQDLDPTNGKRPDGQYLVTAWGRDYDDVVPMNGVISGGGKSSTLKVRVDLRRVSAPAVPDDGPQIQYQGQQQYQAQTQSQSQGFDQGQLQTAEQAGDQSSGQSSELNQSQQGQSPQSLSQQQSQTQQQSESQWTWKPREQ